MGAALAEPDLERYPIQLPAGAAANIDSFIEMEIQRAPRVLLKGRTSILITHRLATIPDADNIVVLNHGRIAEQGTHAELIERGGLYAVEYQQSWLV